MLVQIGFALLSGTVALGFVRLFSAIDAELPGPALWMMLALGIGTVAAGIMLSVRLGEELPIVLCVFLAYLAFTVYTDARIHKVYTLINIVALVGMAVFYVLRKRNAFEILPVIMALLLLALGFFGAYGRGDGYSLAAAVLCVGAVSDNVFNGIFYTIIIGCGCFVIYSIVDYLIHRLREGEHSTVRFWKEKRPLLPSMGLGLIAGLMIVG